MTPVRAPVRSTGVQWLVRRWPVPDWSSPVRRLAAVLITHLHADHYNYFLLESGQPNAENDMVPLQPLPVYEPGPARALPPQPPPPIGPVPTIAPETRLQASRTSQIG